MPSELNSMFHSTAQHNWRLQPMAGPKRAHAHMRTCVCVFHIPTHTTIHIRAHQHAHQRTHATNPKADTHKHTQPRSHTQTAATVPPRVCAQFSSRLRSLPGASVIARTRARALGNAERTNQNIITRGWGVSPFVFVTQNTQPLPHTRVEHARALVGDVIGRGLQSVPQSLCQFW